MATGSPDKSRGDTPPPQDAQQIPLFIQEAVNTLLTEEGRILPVDTLFSEKNLATATTLANELTPLKVDSQSPTTQVEVKELCSTVTRMEAVINDAPVQILDIDMKLPDSLVSHQGKKLPDKEQAQVDSIQGGLLGLYMSMHGEALESNPDMRTAVVSHANIPLEAMENPETMAQLGQILGGAQLKITHIAGDAFSAFKVKEFEQEVRSGVKVTDPTYTGKNLLPEQLRNEPLTIIAPAEGETADDALTRGLGAAMVAAT